MDPLYEALIIENVQYMEEYIREGGDVNDFQFGCSYLHLADELPMVECLVKAGVNLEAVNFDGRTALYYFSWRNKQHIVYFLVDNGAKIEVKDDNDWTPLHEASYNGNMNLVRYFVERRTPIDV